MAWQVHYWRYTLRNHNSDRHMYPSVHCSTIYTSKDMDVTSMPIDKWTGKEDMVYIHIVEVRNRFKGLDLIDRVPDELWMEVHDTVRETGIKTISMEKKSKKAKWLSGEALQIAVKRREAKSKGKKERHKHLNAEFQEIASRDSSAISAKK